MPDLTSLKDRKWFDGDLTSRKVTLDQHIPRLSDDYFVLRSSDVLQDNANKEIVIPEVEEKEEPGQANQVSDTSDIQTYSFSELKFKEIGDLDVFAKKTSTGIMVMLWKPDGVSSTAVNKYTIKLHDQEGNEQPIILKKNKLLLFRPTDNMTYEIVIQGLSKSGDTVAEAVFNAK